LRNTKPARELACEFEEAGSTTCYLELDGLPRVLYLDQMGEKVELAHALLVVPIKWLIHFSIAL